MILGTIPPIGGQPLSVERILGTIFTPLAWLIGIPWKEASTGGWILGVKMVLTEFVAFLKLAAIPVADMTPRTRIILTYATCGFANIGSVGISAAGFGALMPSRRPEIFSLIWKALFAGFLATCLSARRRRRAAKRGLRALSLAVAAAGRSFSRQYAGKAHQQLVATV